MISGNIGSATVKRLDYTVIGDNVNIASRLQGVIGANQIIINKASYQKVKESFTCRAVGEVSLKNKESLIILYEVLD